MPTSPRKPFNREPSFAAPGWSLNLLGILAAAAWFVSQSWRALTVSFSGDDLMNLYHAWILPTRELIVANLSPFTAIYRPAGSAFYVLLFDCFGLDPLPYRIVAYLAMIVNIALLFFLAKLLSGSREIALLTALLGSYHVRFQDLYLNTGTIYDILCYTFFTSSIFYYALVRRQGAVKGKHLFFFYCLCTLALNSKEMAVSLPFVLGAYELLWCVRKKLGSASLFRRMIPHRALLGCLVLSCAAAWAKTASTSPFAGNPEYTPHITFQQFLQNTARYTEELLWIPYGKLPTAVVFLILGAMLAVAFISRNRILLFALTIVIVCPLPVSFISYRGGFVMYIPLIGWALYFGTVFAITRRWLAAKLMIRTSGLRNLFGFACLIIIIGLLSWIQDRDRHTRAYPSLLDQRHILDLKESLQRYSLNGRRTVFLLNDPFDLDGWDSLYIVRLYYRDADLQVRRKRKQEVPTTAPDETLILDYCGGEYREVKANQPAAACQSGS